MKKIDCPDCGNPVDTFNAEKHDVSEPVVTLMVTDGQILSADEVTGRLTEAEPCGCRFLAVFNINEQRRNT